MKFITLTNDYEDKDSIQADFSSAHEIGILRIGEKNLFFKKKFKQYYIPYQDITRIYRRVLLVPAQMCCGKGDLAVENVVVCAGEKELCQVELPGTRAAKICMDELKAKLPGIDFNKPGQNEDKKE